MESFQVSVTPNRGHFSKNPKVTAPEIIIYCCYWQCVIQRQVPQQLLYQVSCSAPFKSKTTTESKRDYLVEWPLWCSLRFLTCLTFLKSATNHFKATWPQISEILCDFAENRTVAFLGQCKEIHHTNLSYIGKRISNAKKLIQSKRPSTTFINRMPTYVISLFILHTCIDQY